MADCFFNGFVDATVNVQALAAEPEADSTTTAGLAAVFFCAGVEVKAGLGAFHLTQSPITIEVEALRQ